MRILATESYFSIVRTFYTGIGCISFFPISGIEYHYQRCVNGGFVGSYSFRSHISCTAYAPVYYASYLFPVRHFIEIGQTLLYGNYGYAYMWTNVVALLLFLLLPLLLLPHLKRSLISRKYDNIE